MNWINRLLAALGRRNTAATSPASGIRPVAWSSMAQFLEDLERLGKEHDELYDTDVRERIWAVIESALIKQTRGYEIPKELGMFSPEANAKLVRALQENITRLTSVFASFQLDNEQKRLTSFLNPKLRTENGSTVDQFFGSP